jgi:hypothetical protein
MIDKAYLHGPGLHFVVSAGRYHRLFLVTAVVVTLLTIPLDISITAHNRVIHGFLRAPIEDSYLLPSRGRAIFRLTLSLSPHSHLCSRHSELPESEGDR